MAVQKRKNVNKKNDESSSNKETDSVKKAPTKELPSDKE